MGKDKRLKVSIWRSLKTKVVFAGIFAILLTVLINLWTIIPVSRDDAKESIQNHMSDVAKISGHAIDKDIELEGDIDKVLTPAYLKDIIDEVKCKGIDSSYAFVADTTGKIIYSAGKPEMNGQSIDNAKYSEEIEKALNGTDDEVSVFSLDFEGKSRYAASYLSATKEYVLVIITEQSDVIANTNDLIERSAYGGLFALVVSGFICFIIANFIAKPIMRITKDVARLAALDLTTEDLNKKSKIVRDESGIMQQSINILRDELAKTISQINEKGETLRDASEHMAESANHTVTAVEQVERAVCEIATGATSQASETQSATENVIIMGDMIEATNDEVKNLRMNADDMHLAGDRAIRTLKELTKINDQTKQAIDTIVYQTNVTNESVEKIREATEVITNIATETNLLSLNASIEAARAGDQGRGFAVVASQIQKLAEQSNDSAERITEIITMLIDESQKSVDTMVDVKRVIAVQDEHVLQTAQAFNEVKGGIDKSIEGIKNISEKARELDGARAKVVDIVQNLTAIAEENAASTEETSATATEVGAIMSEILENSENLNNIAEHMDEAIKKFKL